MPRSYSILLVEPNALLREKMAGVLARDEAIWCVTQVEGRAGLARGVTDLRPDFVLVDLAILREADMVKFIRRFSPTSQIIALVDREAEPYLAFARTQCLDGIIERARVAESMKERILAFSRAGDEGVNDPS